ncbi:hypothetical protein FXO37_24474 [Capsicum annuum]|nr:hypothetical protein FXO37_24474 [Capsicum annuum]
MTILTPKGTYNQSKSSCCKLVVPTLPALSIRERTRLPETGLTKIIKASPVLADYILIILNYKKFRIVSSAAPKNFSMKPPTFAMAKRVFSFDGLFGNLVNEIIPPYQEKQSDSVERHENGVANEALPNRNFRAPPDTGKSTQALSSFSMKPNLLSAPGNTTISSAWSYDNVPATSTTLIRKGSVKWCVLVGQSLAIKIAKKFKEKNSYSGVSSVLKLDFRPLRPLLPYLPLVKNMMPRCYPVQPGPMHSRRFSALAFLFVQSDQNEVMKHRDVAQIEAIEAMQVASATVSLLRCLSLSAYTLPFSVLTLWDYTKYGEVKFLSESLLMALDASLGHALLEMQSWVEAAQCVATIAGVVMQVDSFCGSNINLSAWEDKKNPSESKKYAAKGVTGRKFYNLALNSMMDTPLENSPFLENFVKGEDIVFVGLFGKQFCYILRDVSYFG